MALRPPIISPIFLGFFNIFFLSIFVSTTKKQNYSWPIFSVINSISWTNIYFKFQHPFTNPSIETGVPLFQPSDSVFDSCFSLPVFQLLHPFLKGNSSLTGHV